MSQGAKAILVAVAGVVGGILIFVAVTALVGTGKARSKLGNDRFVVGNAANWARVVDRQGPLLLQDPLGGQRDLFIVHLGGPIWTSVEAHAPGAPRTCQLRWQKPSGEFVDPCDQRRYPADGTGLTRYQTVVDRKGRLVVDLHQVSPS